MREKATHRPCPLPSPPPAASLLGSKMDFLKHTRSPRHSPAHKHAAQGPPALGPSTKIPEPALSRSPPPIIRDHESHSLVLLSVHRTLTHSSDHSPVHAKSLLYASHLSALPAGRHVTVNCPALPSHPFALHRQVSTPLLWLTSSSPVEPHTH